MFCNQCGKENKDGTKFCVQCGAPLRNDTPIVNDFVNTANNMAAANRAENNGVNITAGKKSLIILGLVIILAIVAGINVIRVRASILNISVRNEQQQANGTSEIYETNSYIYYITGSALYRVDKSSNASEKISGSYIYPIAAAINGIFGLDSSGNCYKVSDKSNEAEMVTSVLAYANANNFFVSGKYNYLVSSDGTVSKRLNSDKYSGYSTVIYSGFGTGEVDTAKMYKGYMYMLLYGTGSYSDRTLIRVSLTTGKESVLSDNAIVDFVFDDNRIVCDDKSGDFYVMNLDGSGEQEYPDIEPSYSGRLMYANGCVYYTDSSKLYRINIDNGVSEELGKAYYDLSEVNGSMASVSDGGLKLIDYNGNEITTVRP